ncbi:hypothetical protein WR25_18516 isoform A [Diploscapter pachys]|uniref:protein adenylyltransferase n=2 Tax=Diploscapter pachys TaxID=2018661 RepID=A0A2A2JEW7_9BILA|nr:hypothetical protein WR25_18516 isoform A [Diploscapter pachys]
MSSSPPLLRSDVSQPTRLSSGHRRLDRMLSLSGSSDPREKYRCGKIVVICILVSSICQVLIPMLINSLPKEMCKLHHFQFICGTRKDTVAGGNELISMSSSFFDHQFPLRRKSDSENQELIRRASAELGVVSPFHEQEALAALSAAREKRLLGRFDKAKTIIEHALALSPKNPEVLIEYGILHETSTNDVIEADLCYTKALNYHPFHKEALVHRKRTQPLVSALDAKLLNRVHAKRKQFTSLPHTTALKRAMRESYFMHIYHTVAIEGNTLSLGETRSILETGMAVPGKSIQEHNEVIGMDSALRYINQTLLNTNTINLQDILEMHHRVLGNVAPTDAGRLRNTQVYVGRFAPVAPEYVKEQMDELILWLNDEKTTEIDPIERAAIAHYKLVLVHPFVDGNGRTARLLMNLILMKAGFPPVILPVQTRANYYATLHTANLGDLRPFIRYVANQIDHSLQLYLNAASTKCVGLDDTNECLAGPLHESHIGDP